MITSNSFFTLQIATLLAKFVSAFLFYRVAGIRRTRNTGSTTRTLWSLREDKDEALMLADDLVRLVISNLRRERAATITGIIYLQRGRSTLRAGNAA